jgi:hypothetical protein
VRRRASLGAHNNETCAIMMRVPDALETRTCTAPRPLVVFLPGTCLRHSLHPSPTTRMPATCGMVRLDLSRTAAPSCPLLPASSHSKTHFLYSLAPAPYTLAQPYKIEAQHTPQVPGTKHLRLRGGLLPNNVRRPCPASRDISHQACQATNSNKTFTRESFFPP